MSAASLQPGLTPAEASFLAESTLVTVIPRQALPSLHLLSGTTPPLNPPHRAAVPLWLALLLKRQDRAQILPPPWLAVDSLEAVLEDENSSAGFVGGQELPGEAIVGSGSGSMDYFQGGAAAARRNQTARRRSGGGGNSNRQFGAADEREHGYGNDRVGGVGGGGGGGGGGGSTTITKMVASPPFTSDATEGAGTGILPYQWLEVAHLLLESAADDIPDANGVRRLLRDLRETRAAKLRRGVDVLDGAREVTLDGVGGFEVCENRAFVAGVVDGLRKIGASKEAARKERELEDRENGGGRGGSGGRDGRYRDDDDEDDDEDNMML